MGICENKSKAVLIPVPPLTVKPALRQTPVTVGVVVLIMRSRRPPVMGYFAYASVRMLLNDKSSGFVGLTGYGFELGVVHAGSSYAHAAGSCLPAGSVPHILASSTNFPTHSTGYGAPEESRMFIICVVRSGTPEQSTAVVGDGGSDSDELEHRGPSHDRSPHGMVMSRSGCVKS